MIKLTISNNSQHDPDTVERFFYNDHRAKKAADKVHGKQIEWVTCESGRYVAWFNSKDRNYRLERIWVEDELS